MVKDAPGRVRMQAKAWDWSAKKPTLPTLLQPKVTVNTGACVGRGVVVTTAVAVTVGPGCVVLDEVVTGFEPIVEPQAAANRRDNFQKGHKTSAGSDSFASPFFTLKGVICVAIFSRLRGATPQPTG